jgi:hypothetical protein
LNATYTDEIADGSCQGSYVITRTWHLKDNCNNAAADQVQTITVSDNTPPTFTKPADKTIYTDANCNYNADPSVTGDVTDEHDNCSTGLNATYSDVVANGTCQGNKKITRTWHLSDNCSNAATDQVQTIMVSDTTRPIITTCASSVTVAPDHAGCTATLADYRSSVVASDNCSSVTLTQSPLPGTFIPLGTTAVTITATDACGNSTSCNFIVTVNNTLSVTCINTNPILWYGYSGDQTDSIGVKPTGGTGPYTVTITMNRKLVCDSVLSSGDESWTPGANTNGALSSNISCPVSGAPSVTSNATITSAVGFYIRATLIRDADFTVTVTDKFGCTASCVTHVDAEDVRCFSGNSNIHKVKICHQTGSSKNPCVQICVDSAAVATHLAHGDFVGNCTTDCKAPQQRIVRTTGTNASDGTTATTTDESTTTDATTTDNTNTTNLINSPVWSNTTATPDVKAPDYKFAGIIGKLKVLAMPNPTTTHFKLKVNSLKPDKINIRVIDVAGRIIEEKMNVAPNSTIILGEKYLPGVYFTELRQGKEKINVELIKIYK